MLDETPSRSRASGSDSGELAIFARLHARPGASKAVAEAIADVLPPTRIEPGCLEADAFRSVQDPNLFYIHSRWTSAEDFERHVLLPHTARFGRRVEPLLDHRFEATRTRKIT
jgi:quinol monooxygenase YgiN